jgi:hypothetical protein
VKFLISNLKGKLTHNSVASVHGEGVLQGLTSLNSKLVTRINHPAVSLHQNGRTQVDVRVPPVRGAGGGAASAQNTFVKTVELLTVGDGLKVLALRCRGLLLQVGFDRFVLLVEVGEV